MMEHPEHSILLEYAQDLLPPGQRERVEGIRGETIQETIVAAFESEVEKSKQPGYKPANLDDYDYDVP